MNGESSDDRKCARNKDDERLHDQPLLKVSVWRDSPARGRVLDFALLFEGGTAVTCDSESFPRQYHCVLLHTLDLEGRRKVEGMRYTCGGPGSTVYRSSFMPLSVFYTVYHGPMVPWSHGAMWFYGSMGAHT